MNITREYLEEQLSNLNKQADQSLVTLHNANGAISLIKHLLETFDAEDGASAKALHQPISSITHD